MIELSQHSQRAKKVVGIFKAPINNLYSQVYDVIYDELGNTARDSFSDGWTEAVAYMKSHPDCSMEEIFQAKSKALNERYLNDSQTM